MFFKYALDSKRQCTKMKDMCSAPGCDKALPTKQLQCARCKTAFYCGKACQVAAWPDHKQQCAKKKSCPMFAAHISNKHKGFSVYNVVNKHYQNSEWELILMNEKEILDKMDLENEMATDAGIESYMYKTRMYGMMAEAYRRRGNICMALPYFQKSRIVTDLTNYPSHIDCQNDKYVSYSNLAALFKHTGDFDNSIILYKTMQEMSYNNIEETAKAIKGTGDCFFGMGDYEEALRCFDKADKMIQQYNGKYKIRFNVSIGNTLVAMRYYRPAIVAFMGSGKTDKKDCMQELDHLTNMHLGVATWVYYKELEQKIHTETKEDKDAWESLLITATKLLEEMTKTITNYPNNSDTNELMSCLTLSYSYILYDAKNTKKALQMLQKCLDLEIAISVKSCKFCEQVKDNGVKMLKCSSCNVTRFCDKVCQKGAYCKRPNLKMGITLSHASLCPLLKTWKQVKKGNATAESCVEQQLFFLKTCDPLLKILAKNDFVDRDYYMN